jgi:hypothetical protein
MPKLPPARKSFPQRGDVCPACFEPWVHHPAIQTQCHRLQVALDCLEAITTTCKKNTLERRLAAATLSLLKHCR